VQQKFGGGDLRLYPKVIQHMPGLPDGRRKGRCPLFAARFG
jgi:hypothetical protein